MMMSECDVERERGIDHKKRTVERAAAGRAAVAVALARARWRRRQPPPLLLDAAVLQRQRSRWPRGQGRGRGAARAEEGGGLWVLMRGVCVEVGLRGEIFLPGRFGSSCLGGGIRNRHGCKAHEQL
jgi:hypothetical protein